MLQLKIKTQTIIDQTIEDKDQEQENSISELSSAVERFLKIAYSQEIARDIKATVTREKIKVTVSNIDLDIVNPFAPSLEKSVGMRKHQTDDVKSGSLDKNAECRDTIKHPKTSEAKTCKRLVCMATQARQSRDTLIHSGSPADSQSASEQSEWIRNMILPQNQTETHLRMIVQIILKQSQKHHHPILRSIRETSTPARIV